MSVGAPPSAWMLWATFAAPPSRNSSRSKRTTGTGASGEMRSTSPTTTTGRPDRRAISWRASDAFMHRVGRRLFGGEGQRDHDEQQHQELGVAEVVLEEAGGEHRG